MFLTYLIAFGIFYGLVQFPHQFYWSALLFSVVSVGVWVTALVAAIPHSLSDSIMYAVHMTVLFGSLTLTGTGAILARKKLAKSPEFKEI